MTAKRCSVLSAARAGSRSGKTRGSPALRGAGGLDTGAEGVEMTLHPRRVIHPKPHDNYRVILKLDHPL